jgi:hypothetical protein
MSRQHHYIHLYFTIKEMMKLLHLENNANTILGRGENDMKIIRGNYSVQLM